MSDSVLCLYGVEFNHMPYAVSPQLFQELYVSSKFVKFFVSWIIDQKEGELMKIKILKEYDL